jgi:hypothetical protein
MFKKYYSRCTKGKLIFKMMFHVLKCSEEIYLTGGNEPKIALSKFHFSCKSKSLLEKLLFKVHLNKDY